MGSTSTPPLPPRLSQCITGPKSLTMFVNSRAGKGGEVEQIGFASSDTYEEAETDGYILFSGLTSIFRVPVYVIANIRGIEVHFKRIG